MAPVHLAARLPCFLELYDLNAAPGPMLQEDRKVYLAALGSSEAAQWMRAMQSCEYVDFRHAYLESLVSKGMHKTMADRKWTTHDSHLAF